MSARDLLGALRNAGYNTDSLPYRLDIGKIYRLPAPGKNKSNRDGWVGLIDDGLAVFGDWGTGEKQTWREKGEQRKPNNDHRELRVFGAGNDHAKIAEYARREWANARPAEASHPYLAAKKISAEGLRQDAKGRLLVPVFAIGTGGLVNIQRIMRDGEKRFIRGGKIEACYSLIDGDLPRIFCEGWATGRTVSKATGRAVVVTFSAGNLPKVAAKMAAAGDIVAADNDNLEKASAKFGRKPTTYGAGHKAAHDTGLPWFMPHTPGRDWNDEGEEITRAAFCGTPTSAAPIFNAWSLTRCELKGTAEKQWKAQLAAQTDPQEAANLAYTVAARLSIRAPAQLSLIQIRAFIEASLPHGLVHPITLDRIIERLDLFHGHRKASALGEVMPPADALARHAVEKVEALPKLGPDDYNGVIVLWAPMASGKTCGIGRPFSRWAQKQGKALAICHRVSLVNAMADTLVMSHYGDICRETAWAADGLATCLPSVTISAHAPIIDRARYVFIDEVSQVLRFLAARDHCRTKEATNEQVYNRLREIVTAAGCLIVADAGIDARTLEFLESCRPGERFRIIHMQPKREGIEATYCTGGNAPAAVVGECLAELAAGGRVWLATESKERARNLEQYFSAQGYRVMGVHSDNKGNRAQSLFLANIEAESLHYDIVIVSPVVGSGVSVEHRDTGPHFTLGAFIGGGHRVTPADAAQALRRVRYLRRYVLGIIPNSQTGGQSPEAIVEAWEKAAKIEGAAIKASEFDRLLSGIKADYDNHRSDFSAGLLWQLERAGWDLYRAQGDIDQGIAAELSAIKQADEKTHREALKAAPYIDADELRRLESLPERTEQQNLIIEACLIRHALGVDSLDVDALDVWDHGAGIKRLDRFSALMGKVPAFDDSADSLSLRRYWKATARALAYLFDGVAIEKQDITDELGELLLDRIIAHRHLLENLGIVPASFGVWREDSKGNLLPFPRPKNARQVLADILARLGLKWEGRRARVRVTTPPITLLEDIGQGGYKTEKMGRVYRVTADSIEHMQKWADKRNASRKTERVQLPSVVRLIVGTVTRPIIGEAISKVNIGFVYREKQNRRHRRAA